jgi:hypothetical protein
LDESKRDLAYRFYVTDALQNIPQNRYNPKRFYDILYPRPEDDRSGDEIAAEVIRNAGLHFGG